MQLDDTTIANFWQRVIVGGGEDDCWSWTGRTSNGTAIMAVHGTGRDYTAFRVSWEIFFGNIADTTLVLHSCGNSQCTNPLHLYLSGEDGFWSRVNVIKDKDLCWEWRGQLNDSGYGLFRINGEVIRAHRYAYELENGSIPSDLFVLHRCDNRACCRPSHLFLGTNKDNVDDMVKKGRQNRGEKNANAILDWGKVREIRTRIGNGEIRRALAEEYSVSYATICMIAENKTWRE